MKRTAAIFITVLAAILLALPAYALTPEAENALTWLESAQNPSGSWGDKLDIMNH